VTQNARQTIKNAHSAGGHSAGIQRAFREPPVCIQGNAGIQGIVKAHLAALHSGEGLSSHGGRQRNQTNPVYGPI